MYVKLGFSIAINVDPDVLLVDEVLAVGDESFQRKCSEKFTELRAIRQDDRHRLARDSNMVRSMCDRAAWLENGHMMGMGRASDVNRRISRHRPQRAPRKAKRTRWGFW